MITNLILCFYLIFNKHKIDLIKKIIEYLYKILFYIYNILNHKLPMQPIKTNSKITNSVQRFLSTVIPSKQERRIRQKN